MTNFKELSDKELYTKCKMFGLDVIKARRKFTGLLPEVMAREMKALLKGKTWLKKRGFYNIYDFSSKLAGLSHDQVNEVLRLEKRFLDMPVLHEALIKGKVSVPKLVRIASIATSENQAEMLEKVQSLSKAAIDVFVKDYKNENTLFPEKEELSHKNMSANLYKYEVQKGLFEPITKDESLPVQTAQVIRFGEKSLQLDEDVQTQLLELQQKGIDINNLLREFLKRREEKIEQKLEKVSREVTSEEREKTVAGIQIGRYKKANIRVFITEKFGTKCAVPGCNISAKQIHHEKPFSKFHTHDPKFLKPLCKGHHELQHAVDSVVFKL